jgi:hypothetical protein
VQRLLHATRIAPSATADENLPVTRTEQTDAARQALDQLVSELDVVVRELQSARERAVDLLGQRRQGRSWYEIVAAEQRPLIVEQISSAMAALATVGGQWRRTQARALHDESVSINRIAELYGVTRQRVSALLRTNDQADGEG